MNRPEVNEPIVLGSIKPTRLTGDGVVRIRVIDRFRTGGRNALEIAFPSEIVLGQLIGETARGHRVVDIAFGFSRRGTIPIDFTRCAVPCVVIIDPECIAAEHGDVIWLARMRHAKKFVAEPYVFARRLSCGALGLPMI